VTYAAVEPQAGDRRGLDQYQSRAREHQIQRKLYGGAAVMALTEVSTCSRLGMARRVCQDVAGGEQLGTELRKDRGRSEETEQKKQGDRTGSRGRETCLTAGG